MNVLIVTQFSIFLSLSFLSNFFYVDILITSKIFFRFYHFSGTFSRTFFVAHFINVPLNINTYSSEKARNSDILFSAFGVNQPSSIIVECKIEMYVKMACCHFLFRKVELQNCTICKSQSVTAS